MLPEFSGPTFPFEQAGVRIGLRSRELGGSAAPCPATTRPLQCGPDLGHLASRRTFAAFPVGALNDDTDRRYRSPWGEGSLCPATRPPAHRRSVSAQGRSRL